MSSGTSTRPAATTAAPAASAGGRRHAAADAGRAGEVGFRDWHFYILLAMVAATAAVMVSRNTHPVALLLLSAAVLATGFTGLALHRALAALLGGDAIDEAPLTERGREVLEREKALVLRSIKELEFDRSMGKIGDADFSDLSGRLRARALVLMQDLERTSAPPAPRRDETRPASDAPVARGPFCTQCGAGNDADAKFCKACGARLGGRANG